MEKFLDRVEEYKNQVNSTRNKFTNFYFSTWKDEDQYDKFISNDGLGYLRKTKFNEIFINHTYPNLKEEFELNKKKSIDYKMIDSYIHNIERIYKDKEHMNLLIEIDKSLIKDDFEKKLAHSFVLEAYIKQVSVCIIPFNDLYKINSQVTSWEEKDIYRKCIENSELIVINNINHNKHNKNNVKNISELINTIEERTNNNLTTIFISRIHINDSILETDYYFKQKLFLS